ncbi:unnamed protein product [Ectocarpus sp. 8 AP-2014]
MPSVKASFPRTAQPMVMPCQITRSSTTGDLSRHPYLGSRSIATWGGKTLTNTKNCYQQHVDNPIPMTKHRCSNDTTKRQGGIVLVPFRVTSPSWMGLVAPPFPAKTPQTRTRGGTARGSTALPSLRNPPRKRSGSWLSAPAPRPRTLAPPPGRVQNERTSEHKRMGNRCVRVFVVPAASTALTD